VTLSTREAERPAAVEAPELFRRLIETLEHRGVLCCHWKSNTFLREALRGRGDLDLLVDRADAATFESVLAWLGFKRAVDELGGSLPAVSHFFGLDRPTGALIHLHAYYQVVTGESLLKNYRLPIERLLLEDRRYVDGVPIPSADAELIVFVIRAMAKHSSLVEYLLLQRRHGAGYEALRAELQALLAECDLERSCDLLRRWLPPVDPSLFAECIEALRCDAPLARRAWLARRLHSRLRCYERLRPVPALFLRTSVVGALALRRMRGAGSSKRPANGGAVIAFVGPEATGKSTLAREVSTWLGAAFDVRSVHLGKPPSTWLTLLPNLAVPLLRKRLPRHRTTRMETGQPDGGAGRVSLLFGLRAVFDAWDRRALAISAHRDALRGRVVLCDRYPSTLVGAMDSPRLRVLPRDGWRGRLLRWMSELERRLYRQIPPPDTVIRLTVPVQVAIERNRERQKKGKETDHYVAGRHARGVVPVYPARTIEFDSDRSQTQTVAAARQLVWDAL
jgi:thymidylate kinase